MRALFAALLILTLAPAARALTAMDALRADTENRARTELTELFRSLCPDQCLLVSVVANVGEVPSSVADPGFEALSGGAKVPQLQGLSVAVVVDDQLPSAFRTRLKDVVSLRVREFGVPPSISIQPLAFPSRAQPSPAPAPMMPLPMPMMPLPMPMSPPASASEPAKQQPATPMLYPTMAAPAQPTLHSRLIEEAPALVAVGLLALALLVVGALLFVAIRKQASAAEWVEDEAPVSNSSASSGPVETYPVERAQRLERTLTDERALRNAVLRSALAQGETTLIARWVRELGDFLIVDLYADPSLASSMSALATELGKPYTVDAAGRAQALSELEGRVLAARLSRTAESSEAQFEFLEGIRPERFLSAYPAVSTAARETALRFAPTHLRTAILRQLSPAERAEIALAWTRRAEITPAYAAAVADEWKAALATSGSGHASSAVGSLFDVLPRLEQDALLKKLQSEGVSFVDQLLAESQLVTASPAAVAAAALSVPSNRLAIYLGGADEEIREHVLAQCPAKLQRELREELSQGVFATREEFFSARRLILEALRAELSRRPDPTTPKLTSLAG